MEPAETVERQARSVWGATSMLPTNAGRRARLISRSILLIRDRWQAAPMKFFGYPCGVISPVMTEGLRRLRLRRIKFVREQFYLAAVAQNLKRLVRFLNMRAQPAMASA